MRQSPRSHLRTRTLVPAHRPRTERQETACNSYALHISKLIAAQAKPSDGTVPAQTLTITPNGTEPCTAIIESDQAAITIEFTQSFVELELPIRPDAIERIIKRDKYSLPLGCERNATAFLPVAIYDRLQSLVERLRCLPESHAYWQQHSHIRLHLHLQKWAPGWSVLAIDDPDQPNRAAAFAVPPAAWKDAPTNCFWWIVLGTDRDTPFAGCLDNRPTDNPERFLREVQP